jgi:hypothetical protein
MTMPQETTYSGFLGEAKRLIQSLLANAAELPHLELSRIRLEELLGRIEEVLKEQAALTASKQETSKQVKDLLISAQRLFTLLNQGVKQHYGIRSEKLAEFGLQPFRGRSRAEKPAPTATPPAPLPTPAATT